MTEYPLHERDELVPCPGCANCMKLVTNVQSYGPPRYQGRCNGSGKVCKGEPCPDCRPSVAEGAQRVVDAGGRATIAQYPCEGCNGTGRLEGDPDAPMAFKVRKVAYRDAYQWAAIYSGPVLLWQPFRADGVWPITEGEAKAAARKALS